MRGVATRRSLDSNAPERKSGRAAFKSARLMFEQQRALERGDESYGTTIYSTSTLGREDRIMEDAAEENGAKSINDLIKNFEQMSTPVSRGRNFSSARVHRSASPVKWKTRRSAPTKTYTPDEDNNSIPTIPAELPGRRKPPRPSIEVNELDTTFSRDVPDSVGGHSRSQSSLSDVTQVETSQIRRTDMSRLPDPNLPHHFISGIPTETDFPPTRTKLTWSDAHILVGETHTPEDYERGNPDLDPVAESAVYELEKRLDKMDQFKVDLEKDDNGYGLSIIGMGIGADSGVERLGIYVNKVFPGQAAERVGIQMADQIVEVDGVSLVGVSHQFASDALRGTNQHVRFMMARDRDQESSEVRNLIVRTLEQEQEIQQEQQSTDSESDQEELNGTYEVERDDDPRLMRDVQSRLLEEISSLRSENDHLHEEKNQLRAELDDASKRIKDLEDQLAQARSLGQPRSCYSTLESNTLDALDELEESRVDDSLLALWSNEDVLVWLKNNHLETLVPLFKVHNIDGKYLDKIREKNDSKMLKQLGIQKDQRAQLRTALRQLASTC